MCDDFGNHTLSPKEQKLCSMTSSLALVSRPCTLQRCLAEIRLDFRAGGIIRPADSS
jgi:hypothetical protein